MVQSQLQQPISSLFWDVPIRWHKHRVHHFENSALSNDFCLEAIQDQSGYYMTSCKAGVRQGDRICVEAPTGQFEYEVDEIDYYSDPNDMWIAKLSMV